MVTKTINVVTRSSRLARIQTDEALQILKSRVPELHFKVEPLTSPGDRDVQTPLTDAAVPQDFFTRDLDQALLSRKADLAVHSAKDLPQTMPDGLVIAALLPARDIRDALVLRAGLPTDAIPTTIGTSSPRRDEMIRKWYPTAQTKPLRGTIDQRLEKLDAGEFDAILIAACALERLGLADRISRYVSTDPVPQQGRLALVVRSDHQELRELLRPFDVRRTAGLVAIVGCPADASLLSFRARRYLDQADIVIHDRLIPDEILLSIGDRGIPVGKAGGEPSTPQSEIHRRILIEAESGKLVVRLHGGDPTIFGHLAEQLDFLTAWNLRIDLISTLTAAQVAASHACAPLTHRGDGGHVHFLSGHTPKGEQPEKLPGPGEGNLAVYMGVTEAPEFAERLTESGWPPDANVLIGERLGYRDEAVRSIPLSALAQETIQKPAVFLVGVRRYPSPIRTLFVGTDPEHFLNHGPLIHWPLIKLISRPLKERTDHLHQALPSCDGIIFPSRHAVHALMEAVLDGADARALAGKKLLAVGPSTARELGHYGLRADASVDNYGGVQELARTLTGDIAGVYLYPCSNESPVEQRKALLANKGIKLKPLPFYENRTVPFRELPRTDFQRVLFTSTSTVNAYFKQYPNETKATRTWLAVGPSTLKALQRMGLPAECI